jgi:hypothetical protein
MHSSSKMAVSSASVLQTAYSSLVCTLGRSAPRSGASAAFADPRLTAEEAHPVWLPETGAARLHFTARAIAEADAGQPGVAVSALPNVEHILVDTAGRQHVVLRSGSTHMQMIVSGCGAAIDPVELGLSICHRGEISAAAKELAALEGVLSGQQLPNTAPPWTAQTKRFRDALIGLDCRRAGATLRETAVVIYGRERIEREWPGNGLRQRVRRDVKRGEALCDGGYRSLLR